jgi:hypothetical protein
MTQSITVEHGLLAVVGNLAREHGLIDAFEDGAGSVQRRGLHSAGKKLVQVLFGISAGHKTMIEFQEAGRPIYEDRKLLRAVGFEGDWAENSTLLDFLRSFEAEDTQKLRSAISVPLARQIKGRLGRAAELYGNVVVDLDLSGQRTTGEANSFEGTSFGYMAGKLAKGYQLAGAFVDVSPSERWMVAARVLTGSASSSSSVPMLLSDLEQVIGKPKRRVGAVATLLESHRSAARQLKTKIQQTASELAQLHDRVRSSEVETEILRRQHAGMKPHGRGLSRRREIEQDMAKHHRTKRAACEKIKRRHKRLANLHHKLGMCETDVDKAKAWLNQLAEDNAANPNPVAITIRADSAFGTAKVLNMLYELGYEILIKAFNGENNRSLFSEVDDEQWRSVGRKAEAVEHPYRTRVASVRHDMRLVAYQRTNVDGKKYRAVFVTTLPEHVVSTRQLVTHYNQRQHAEAGYAECKGPFSFGAPRLRKHAANSVFAMMVMVAYNLMRTIARRATKGLKRRRWKTIAFLVGVLAHARARVRIDSNRIRLTLSKQSIYPGTSIEFRLE